MNKIFLFAAVAAVALSSCSKNEVYVNPADAANAIGFGTYVGSATKATAKTKFDNGDVFAIKAYYTAQKEITATDATLKSFMDNQIVTAAVADDVTTWSYSPIKYWPNNDGDKVSFFAVTDATSAAPATLNVSDAATSFTIAGPATDIMIASALNKTKSTKTTNTIEFVFQHTMAQLNFTAKLAKALTANSETDDKTTVTVKSLTVNYGDAKIAGNGTFTYDNTTANSGSWGEGASTRVADVFDTEGTDAGIGEELNNSDATVIGEPLMLLPTATANGYTVTVVYTVATVDNDKDTNNSIIDNECEFVIAPNKMNTKYTYNLEIGLTEVEVTGSYGAWEDATTGGTTVTVESSTSELK